MQGQQDFAAVDEAFLGALHGIVGQNLTTSESVRDQHGRGESYHPSEPPDVVVFPENTGEVAAIVKLCARHRVPVIPYGTGTSLEGHVAALHGGVSIDFSNMKRIVQVNAEDLDVTVEAGVTRRQLNEHLRDTGLFFPVDPGADASLGGMAACRASGTNAVRYGTMRENVLAMTVVMADGRVVKTSNRARKSASGYDLTRLIVGSEGTLGIITELTVRLYGIPEAMSSAICVFPTVKAAVDTVILIIQTGIPVARIELLDEMQMKACNQYSKMDLKEAPTLFFEFHGTVAGVAEQAEMAGAIAAEHGGEEFQWETKAEDRNKLWRARHDAYYALLAYKPGYRAIVGDVCVPISRLAECIEETQKELEASHLMSPIVGHVGDGNFHVSYMVDPDSEEDLEEAKRLVDNTVMRALAMGGTCSGEHGVGYGKMGFLEAEHGAGALLVMRAIKLALDPRNILNPGKIVRL